MKRLLLTCAAATATMLTACIDVDLASSAQAADGTRISQISNESDAATQGGGDAGSGACDRDTRRGDAANTRFTPRDDVRTRS